MSAKDRGAMVLAVLAVVLGVLSPIVLLTSDSIGIALPFAAASFGCSIAAYVWRPR